LLTPAAAQADDVAGRRRAKTGMERRGGREGGEGRGRRPTLLRLTTRFAPLSSRAS